MTALAMGAATRPPKASLPALPPSSTTTATATLGLSAGAKEMNHAWGALPFACCAVPVLPATGTPGICAAAPVPGTRLGPTVVRATKIGPVLADTQGMTLYTHQDDAHGVPICYGRCARSWPPFLAGAQARPATKARTAQNGCANTNLKPTRANLELVRDAVLCLHNRERAQQGRPKLRWDPFEDWEHFSQTLLQQKRLGIFTIGGGVPRNWAQQFGPYVDLLARRGREEIPRKRYHYGLRICPEPVYWGGLSGSPYSEAVSWGKFVPPEEGGKFAELFLDATVGLPLICAAVFERLGK